MTFPGAWNPSRYLALGDMELDPVDRLTTWMKMNPNICHHCQEQEKKSHRGKPHEDLVKVDEVRLFKGQNPAGFQEQDYFCITCKSKFTRSSDRNGLAWTLWQK